MPTSRLEFGKVLFDGKSRILEVVNTSKKGQKVDESLVVKESRYCDSSMNEIRVLSQLKHKSIIRYRGYEKQHKSADGGVCEDKVVLFLEKAQGGDVYEALSKVGGKFSEELARTVFVQMVEAVKFLHSQNIAHRDLKLENFLVMEKYYRDNNNNSSNSNNNNESSFKSNSDEEKEQPQHSTIATTTSSPRCNSYNNSNNNNSNNNNNSFDNSEEVEQQLMKSHVKLADFEFACERTESSRRRQDRAGTESYLSPEQVRGDYCPMKSDVWAMGVALYLMVCGRYPRFNTQNLKENCCYAGSSSRRELELPAELSTELKELLRSILESEEEKRPSIEDLKKHSWSSIGSRKVHLFPHSSADPLRRFHWPHFNLLIRVH